jgi:hypothetical protein
MQRDVFAQPLLFELAPLTEPDYEATSTLAERFAAFHAANPYVFRALLQLALDTQDRGVRRWSINAAFEVLRWQYALQTQGDEYRLNNNYRAFYARMIMETAPRLRGFFETRVQKSE